MFNGKIHYFNGPFSIAFWCFLYVYQRVAVLFLHHQTCICINSLVSKGFQHMEPPQRRGGEAPKNRWSPRQLTPQCHRMAGPERLCPWRQLRTTWANRWAKRTVPVGMDGSCSKVREHQKLGLLRKCGSIVFESISVSWSLLSKWMLSKLLLSFPSSVHVSWSSKPYHF